MGEECGEEDEDECAAAALVAAALAVLDGTRGSICRSGGSDSGGWQWPWGLDIEHEGRKGGRKGIAGEQRGTSNAFVC
jgi:hypothetical protein